MNQTASITLQNAQRRLRVRVEPLQNFAESALLICLQQTRKRLPETMTEIDVVLVSDQRIAALHKKFMKIAGPTDVITFQHGEIVISVETAKQNARRFRSSLEHEIRLYLVHGFLHLLGFDDKTVAQASVMERTQRQILAKALPAPTESV